MVNAPRSNPSSGIKILLVEDNHISRQLMTDFLVTKGFEVQSLASAHAFLLAMAAYQPDVVLLDLKLPGISGYTVLQQLQQQPEWKNLPVIVVSAFAFCADRDRALALGARRYLVKPVKLPELIQAIREEVYCSLV